MQTPREPAREHNEKPARDSFHLKEGVETIYFDNPWNLSKDAFTLLWHHFVKRRTVLEIIRDRYSGNLDTAANETARRMRKAARKVLTGPGKPEEFSDEVVALHTAVELGKGRLRWRKWAGMEQPKAEEDSPPQPPSKPEVNASPPNRCPRCNGFMMFERDRDGAYSTCLPCGYVYEFGATAALELEGEDHRRRRRPQSGKVKL